MTHVIDVAGHERTKKDNQTIDGADNFFIKFAVRENNISFEYGIEYQPAAWRQIQGTKRGEVLHETDPNELFKKFAGLLEKAKFFLMEEVRWDLLNERNSPKQTTLKFKKDAI